MTKKEQRYRQNCCTGCGLCQNDLQPAMRKDPKGFEIPEHINDEMSGYCSVNNYVGPQTTFEMWGKSEGIYAGSSAHKDIRFQASSGGVLTQLAIYLLEHNFADGIIHTGVAPSSPIRTSTFCSRTREEVLSHCGSRYAASSPLKELNGMLKDGGRYAFIGKPCDIGTLCRYLKKHPSQQKQIILTMAFFCAGIPSERANITMLHEMGCEVENCVSLRYRGLGWPGRVIAQDTAGREYQISYAEAWGKYLGRDMRTICRYCMDGIGEFSDVACADLWYQQPDGSPDFAEHPGRNAIFCRTVRGLHFVRDAAENGELIIHPYDPEVSQMQKILPYQYRRRATMEAQIVTSKLLGKYVPRYNQRMLIEAARFIPLRKHLGVVKGTALRILQGKI